MAMLREHFYVLLRQARETGSGTKSRNGPKRTPHYWYFPVIGAYVIVENALKGAHNLIDWARFIFV